MGILLGRHDVNFNNTDKYGGTLLCRAASKGDEGMVQMLLRRDDVNPNHIDMLGQTPLFRAAFCGHEGVVEILLGQKDINPDKPDVSGQTPLECAVRKGLGRVAALLQPSYPHHKPVFRTVQGPHRDGGGNAKRTGRDTTGQDR